MEYLSGEYTPYTLALLDSMRTIESGHFDNLKVNCNGVQVWLSRMTMADGMPYNNQVTVTELINGDRVTIAQYEAK